ncbi:hypothetical protein GCM10007874_32440 [Labrys miyagiensis]|uniref:Uncharacterized protein n=1 Tax=Labrys miyagiensis TaxID=346912 RepID=A0ABQ6CKS3_9HYPH|nr:hypothetical protein GCM10007874_32440 [Labrys miyagiensis]
MEPHCASENAPNAVDGGDPMAGPAQEIQILAPMRPANRDNKRLKPVHINFSNIPRYQFE